MFEGLEHLVVDGMYWGMHRGRIGTVPVSDVVTRVAEVLRKRGGVKKVTVRRGKSFVPDDVRQLEQEGLVKVVGERERRVIRRAEGA